ARAVVGPGIHFMIPFLHRVKIEETKHTTLDLEPQVIQLRDDLVYEVDCKVVYQIVNLRKAMIEIDDLVSGLQNRVVIAVQRIVSAQDRESVKDVDRMCAEIREELEGLEDQWGVRILQFGFSNISPSPASLEITQLDLLAREKLRLYAELYGTGMSEEAAVALISGAVISMQAGEPEANAKVRARMESTAIAALESELEKEKPDDIIEGLSDESDGPFGLEDDNKEDPY
ncbi:MAG: regulator of protease activity HflC (stomatin/prohibitin superfamily), partial [Planctomycetota bacterium]